MEFFKARTHIHFMRLRKVTGILSIVLCVLSLAFLSVRGLNWGLDFTGGTLIEVHYPDNANLEAVRNVLHEAGYDDAVVQNFGTSRDVLVRIAPREDVEQQTLADDLLVALRKQDAQVEMRRVEFVGPQVGKELAERGGIAIIIALVIMMIYVAIRFQYRFAVSAAIALAHDPLIILGVFSLFQIPFDLTVLAALLAVIGYSLNDTIVVYDRVRENFRKHRKGSVVEIMDLSINETLSRTVLTSGSTLVVVIVLLLFGGALLFGFSLALLLGIVIGTYSSIYIAGTLAVAMGLTREDLLPPTKEELERQVP